MVWAHRVAELELRGEGQRGGCVGSPVFLGGMCRWSQWREFVAITVHPSCHWREVKPTQGLIDGNRMSGGGPPPPPPGGGGANIVSSSTKQPRCSCTATYDVADCAVGFQNIRRYAEFEDQSATLNKRLAVRGGRYPCLGEGAECCGGHPLLLSAPKHEALHHHCLHPRPHQQWVSFDYLMITFISAQAYKQ